MKVIWLILMVLVGGVADLRAQSTAPNLTDTQRQMLEMVEDFTGELDGPGLYALFTIESGDDPVALESVIANPAAHRGQGVEVTGELARVREMGLSRQLKDRQTVWEWSLVTDDGQVVVVYVAGTQPFGIGRQLNVAGRFYKIWRDRDQTGQERDYVVLVAGDQISEIEPQTSGGEGESEGVRGMSDGLIIIAAVVLLWLTFRRVRALAEKRQQTARRVRSSVTDDSTQQATPDISPADALAEMDQRNQDKDTK